MNETFNRVEESEIPDSTIALLFKIGRTLLLFRILATTPNLNRAGDFEKVIRCLSLANLKAFFKYLVSKSKRYSADEVFSFEI